MDDECPLEQLTRLEEENEILRAEVGSVIARNLQLELTIKRLESSYSENLNKVLIDAVRSQRLAVQFEQLAERWRIEAASWEQAAIAWASKERLTNG
jgi:hypothetical protein